MKLKGKVLKRVLDADQYERTVEDIPLITDTTELITPEVAEAMLKSNKSNRPINWNKVEQFAKEMEAGNWHFHSQGIILDDKNNILTGQKRLWAIVYSDKPQYMRISRGTKADKAKYIDRGIAQTARDLASRETERKHSPMEQSIARAMLAHNGNVKPSVDDIADKMAEYSKTLETAIKRSRGIKKTKSIYMIMAAICICGERYFELFGMLPYMAESLGKRLETPVEKCWNRGAAFTLAMEKAVFVTKRVKARNI